MGTYIGLTIIGMFRNFCARLLVDAEFSVLVDEVCVQISQPLMYAPSKHKGAVTCKLHVKRVLSPIRQRREVLHESS